MMKNITVIAVVYNEERRIESFLESFAWSDDLIIIDKSSTDRTPEISRSYTDKVLSAPYSDTGDEARLGLEIAKNEWVMILTASDIIHPRLVTRLLETINASSFDYDVIEVPYRIYVLGMQDPKRSPWCATMKQMVMRKSVISTSTRVHHESGTSSRNVYSLPDDGSGTLSHLTHETVDLFLERHVRYTRLEATAYEDGPSALRESAKELINSVKYVIFRKKSFLARWDGAALGVAYISYFIMKYLFVWEKFRGRGPAEYKALRDENKRLWMAENKPVSDSTW